MQKKICETFTEPEPSSDGAEEVDDTNTIFADLQKRTLEPQSKIHGIDNKELRNQWITLAVENIENLEEKVKIMKPIKITKLKDILQHELDSNRIDEIFEEYKKRGDFYHSTLINDKNEMKNDNFRENKQKMLTLKLIVLEV